MRRVKWLRRHPGVYDSADGKFSITFIPAHWELDVRISENAPGYSSGEIVPCDSLAEAKQIAEDEMVKLAQEGTPFAGGTFGSYNCEHDFRMSTGTQAGMVCSKCHSFRPLPPANATNTVVS